MPSRNLHRRHPVRAVRRSAIDPSKIFLKCAAVPLLLSGPHPSAFAQDLQPTASFAHRGFAAALVASAKEPPASLGNRRSEIRASIDIAENLMARLSKSRGYFAARGAVEIGWADASQDHPYRTENRRLHRLARPHDSTTDTGEPQIGPEGTEDPNPMRVASNIETQPSPTVAADQPAPQRMVDALYSAFGDNHSRAVHAKGIMATGTFEPSPEANNLSRASIFAHGKIPVLVRFSDFTGIPDIPDTVGDANPRGFAIKFALPDGASADVVSHSFNGFPTATAAEFRDLLLAIGASGPTAAKPTPLDSFLAGHPIAKTFLTTQKPAPASYATLSYYGVNSFRFTSAAGVDRYVRYRFVPVDGEAFLTVDQLAAMGPNYLQTELPVRLASSSSAFIWYAQIADSSDVVADPSVAWPETRKLVKLGTLRIERMADSPTETDRATMFAPLNVPDGIAPADPMLNIRQGAYPLSFVHRQ